MLPFCISVSPHRVRLLVEPLLVYYAKDAVASDETPLTSPRQTAVARSHQHSKTSLACTVGVSHDAGETAGGAAGQPGARGAAGARRRPQQWRAAAPPRRQPVRAAERQQRPHLLQQQVRLSRGHHVLSLHLLRLHSLATRCSHTCLIPTSSASLWTHMQIFAHAEKPFHRSPAGRMNLPVCRLCSS